MTTDINTAFTTEDHGSISAAMIDALNRQSGTTIRDWCSRNPEDRDSVTEEEFTTIIERTLPALKLFAEGSRLEEELGHIVSGLCTGVHFRRRRLRSAAEKLDAQLAIAWRDFDGSEIANTQIEDMTSQLKDMDITIQMLSTLRQVLITALLTHFDIRWVPPGGGSYTSSARRRTSALIDAGDYLAARRKQAADELSPIGTFIAFAGDRDFGDDKAVWEALDAIRNDWPDMILVHTGCGAGGDLIADKWALARAVTRIVVKPDFDKHGRRRAPFERNRVLMRQFTPEILVATPGSGYIENLVDEMRKINRKVIRIGLPDRAGSSR